MCINICMYICIHIYIYVYMYVCIYTWKCLIPYQTQWSHPELSRVFPGQARPSQTRPGQARPSQAGPKTILLTPTSASFFERTHEDLQYIYIYIYIYMHTYIYIYVYIYMAMCHLPRGTGSSQPAQKT